jgi:glutamine synthetase
VKPKAVLAYCREKDIRAIDLRFVDLGGDWKHVTLPVGSLTETAFELGFGQEVALVGTAGEIRQQAVLVPIAEAHFVDPMLEQPTLVILSGILDAMSREESWLDSRSVASRSVQYLQSTGIADAVAARTFQPFSLQHTRAENSDDSVPPSRVYLACNAHDEDFAFRCKLASLATEAGILIDRHYRSEKSTSEIVLGASSLPELCDDLMMVRYLIDQLAIQQGRRRIDTDAAMSTQWMLSRGGESIFSGASQLGLSELGWYAVGGILEHAATLAAVALATPGRVCDPEYRWSKSIQSGDPHSLCKVIFGYQDPRQRAIEVRGLVSDGNPYLQSAAVLMAMIDGIQNKYAVSHALRSRVEETVPGHGLPQAEPTLGSARDLRKALSEDCDFLMVGDVFSESLLQTMTRYLEP